MASKKEKKAAPRKRKTKADAEAEPESAGLTPKQMAARPPAAVAKLPDAIAAGGESPTPNGHHRLGALRSLGA